ncbi:RNA polymerase sigma factor [Larkinella soli]|uniref:RNA polymerase sigma factor n=1 Tax=Larkinella soli TaxID=1770527 RepID=UPI000FFB4D6F|nr:sigma-70 family RNA polymerase sigma factor [Larkinella soli]
MADSLPSRRLQSEENPLTQLPDPLLWKRVRAGEERAFEELIRRYYPPLYQYGLRYTRDMDLLKDSIQDLFVELWIYHRNMAQTEFVRVYLFKSLRRKVFRNAAGEGSREPLDEEAVDHFLISENAEDELIQTELSAYQRSRLHALLRTLSNRQREAIHLKFFAALSNEKIAEVMGLNYQSVANLLHRAVNRLREGWHTLLQ